MIPWVTELVHVVSACWFGPDEAQSHLYVVRAVLALLLVAVACGACGSLVIGNRMAFFSDAMAHTAMAGVTLAVLGVVLLTNAAGGSGLDSYRLFIPLVMAGFGAAIGVAMTVIQERTALSTDTVIGVFFALALGFAGLLLPALQAKARIPLEEILFGQLLFLDDTRLLLLLGMAVVTLLFIGSGYNGLLLGSFNPSLANSRGVGVRRNNYLFVILLAVVVNLSVYAVGVLLINALLVVPAAAAANVSRNLRQMFWFTLIGCVFAAAAGYRFSQKYVIAIGDLTLSPGPSGSVVLACVGLFFLSLLVRWILRRFFGARVPCPHDGCSHTHDEGSGHRH